MSLFSSILNLFSSGSKRKAYDRAAQVQIDNAQRGIGAINAQNAINTQSFAPYQDAGVAAVGAERDLLGLGGATSQNDAIQQLQDSPLFQSLFRTGQETVLQNAAATGGLRGGNVQHSLADVGIDTLARVIQQQLQNLGGLSGQGLTAAQGSTSLGQRSAEDISQLWNYLGRAQAGGILGKEGTKQEMFASGGDILQTLLSAIPGMPGGASGGTNFFANVGQSLF